MVKWISFAITACGFVGCLTFVSRYWWVTRGSWWGTEAGRMLMVVQANLGALFLLIMVNAIFGLWPGRTVVTFSLYATFAVEAWWPLRLLGKSRRGIDDQSH